MCMPVNSFLSGLVQDFPTFTGQCNVFRNQRHAATVGGNGSPRQAQFLSGGGQRQLVSGHPVLKVSRGHNIAVLFQCEAIQGTRGYLNIITPCYIKAPFTDLSLFKNTAFFERLQHHKTLDVRVQVNGVLFAIVPSYHHLLAFQCLYGLNFLFAHSVALKGFIDVKARANFALLQYILDCPLTTAADATNNSRNVPHGQITGLVACANSQRTTALRGFFVRAVWFRACYDGLYGDTFGCASADYWSTNPVQSVTRCLVASGDGFNKPIVRVDIMTTHAQNPSSVSQTLAAVICILQSLNPDTYTHTRTILAALQAHGIKRDLRSVQRYLVALCDYSLVEHDNHHPKGWKLRTNPNKYAVEAILAVGVQS